MNADAVLVADDDPDFRELARLAIESWGREVLEACDFTEVVSVARAEHARISLVLLDYFMPGDRMSAVAALRELVGVPQIVLATACADVDARVRELDLSRSLAKPVDLRTLEDVIRASRGTSDDASSWGA